MRVSLWIVTYRNPVDLHNNLSSLFTNAGSHTSNLSVNIINNHSSFDLAFEWLGRVRVWHNVLRSDQSLGHLARNWNQAIITGFGSLTAPANDLVVLSQDDVIWQQDWLDQLTALASSHSLITQGVGDAVVALQTQAVRKIGLWDERFAPSFYHDGDYFLRALIHNRESSSINDPAHGRILNPLTSSFASVPAPNQPRSDAKNLSYGRANLPHQVWMRKWPMASPINWTPELIQNPPQASSLINFVTYPHFEMDVENLAAKNYLV
jgi:hypothetical protein